MFTAYTAWTEGLRYAIVPHLYLIAAYEIAQRLFPKNIGAPPVPRRSLRQKLTYGTSTAVAVPQVPLPGVNELLLAIGTLRRDIAMLQSAFRSRASLVQRHCEAIAALDGAETERRELGSRFDRVLSKTTETNRAMSKFGIIFKFAYSYGSRPFMTLLTLAPILLEKTRGRGLNDGETIVRYRNLLAIIIEALVGNGELLTLHATNFHYQGLAKRLCMLEKKLGELDATSGGNQSLRYITSNDKIAFSQVRATTCTESTLDSP